MRVIAKKLGFHGGSRRRPGSIFDMPESVMKKDADGKPVLPQWVEPAPADPAQAAAMAAAAAKADKDQFGKAALQASGSAFGADKKAGDIGKLV